MSPEIIGVIGLIALVVLLFTGMWIGLAMAFVGFFGYVSIRGLEAAMGIAAKIPYTTVAYYSLSTIPLFVLMGVLIFKARIGQDLYETAYKWVGQFPGGLAMATVLACALFGAITGTSSAALTAIGKNALPEMKKYGYDDSLASASMVTAGTLAIMIPPSIAFIIYAILTEQSVGELFIAGIIPGIILTVLFLIVIVVMITIRPGSGPPGPKTTLKEKIISAKSIWHVLLLFLLVLGGIYFGVFTPTEAGAIGAFGATIIGFATRRLSFKSFMESLFESAQISVMIFLLIIGAYFFMKFLAISKIPLVLSEIITQLSVSPLIIMVGIIVLFIILGMFLDIYSAIMLTVPILYPLVISYGFSPIWFGVLVVLVIQIGLVTPPVGLDAYILSGVSGIPVYTIYRGIWPFFIGMLVLIVLLVAFPDLTLVLPRLMKS